MEQLAYSPGVTRKYPKWKQAGILPCVHSSAQRKRGFGRDLSARKECHECNGDLSPIIAVGGIRPLPKSLITMKTLVPLVAAIVCVLLITNYRTRPTSSH